MTPEGVVGDELVGLDVDGPDQVQVVDELDEIIINLFFLSTMLCLIKLESWSIVSLFVLVYYNSTC